MCVCVYIYMRLCTYVGITKSQDGTFAEEHGGSPLVKCSKLRLNFHTHISCISNLHIHIRSRAWDWPIKFIQNHSFSGTSILSAKGFSSVSFRIPLRLEWRFVNLPGTEPVALKDVFPYGRCFLAHIELHEKKDRWRFPKHDISPDGGNS